MHARLKFFALASAGVIMAVAMPLHAGKYNAVVDIGAPMPAFHNLPAVDGTTLSSSDIGEDIVVLVFLANHCPWVKGLDGDLVKTVNQLKGKSVRVVGISVNHRPDDRLEAMKAHARKNGYNFTYVFDQSQETGRKLGATRTPEYFVFNKQRKLVYMGLLHNSPASMRGDGTISYTRGEPTEFHLLDAVHAALAGREVAQEETRAQGCSVEYEKKQ